MADSVQLTDLNVITRYSIAVRSATADRDELIETLRADLTWLERGQLRPRPNPPAEPAESPSAETTTQPLPLTQGQPQTPAHPQTPGTATAEPASPAKPADARKTAAKKPAARRTAG